MAKKTRKSVETVVNSWVREDDGQFTMVTQAGTIYRAQPKGDGLNFRLLKDGATKMSGPIEKVTAWGDKDAGIDRTVLAADTTPAEAAPAKKTKRAKITEAASSAEADEMPAAPRPRPGKKSAAARAAALPAPTPAPEPEATKTPDNTRSHPGVLSFIEGMLRDAGQAGEAVSLDTILRAMMERFPDRSIMGMAITLSDHVRRGLPKVRGVNVQSRAAGDGRRERLYWI